MGAAARRYAEARSGPRALEPPFEAWREAHREEIAAPALADVRVGRAPMASAAAGATQ